MGGAKHLMVGRMISSSYLNNTMEGTKATSYQNIETNPIVTKK